MSINDLYSSVWARLKKSCFGIVAFVVSDRDGVVIFKCIENDYEIKGLELETATSTPFLSRYSTCLDGTSKLLDNLKQEKEISQSKEEFVIVKFSKITLLHQSYCGGVVLSLYGLNNECDLGQMLNFAKEIEPFMSEVSKVSMIN